MAATSQASTSRPPASSFTLLPRELRDMIYHLLILSATLKPPPPSPAFSNLGSWQSSSPSHSEFDLQISTNQVTHPCLRLPSNLLYTSRQVNFEMSTIIYSRMHHIQVFGDFLTGLSPTASIFDILASRPWITKAVKTVNVVLRVAHVLPVNSGVAVNSRALAQHPWLRERLRKAKLKVKEFEMRDCGIVWRPTGFWHVNKWGLTWSLGKTSKANERLGGLEVVGAGKQRNTLPDLARLLETFTLLEKIDIETEHRHVLSLFLSPRDIAESFRALAQRGLDVNIVVKGWQLICFCDMLRQNGIEKGAVCWGRGEAENPGQTAITFQLMERFLYPGESGKAKGKEKSASWVWVRRNNEAENGMVGGPGVIYL